MFSVSFRYLAPCLGGVKEEGGLRPGLMMGGMWMLMVVPIGMGVHPPFVHAA